MSSIISNSNSDSVNFLDELEVLNEDSACESIKLPNRQNRIADEIFTKEAQSKIKRFAPALIAGTFLAAGLLLWTISMVLPQKDSVFVQFAKTSLRVTSVFSFIISFVLVLLQAYKEVRPYILPPISPINEEIF